MNTQSPLVGIVVNSPLLTTIKLNSFLISGSFIDADKLKLDNYNRTKVINKEEFIFILLI